MQQTTLSQFRPAYETIEQKVIVRSGVDKNGRKFERRYVFNKRVRVLSFGAGVDSTAMLIKMYEDGKPFIVVHADVGAETKTTYPIVEFYKRWCEERGIEFIIVKRGDFCDDKRNIAEYHFEKQILPSKARRDCLPPDQEIITADGMKRIDQVKVGDLVLTHKGRFMPITGIFTRPHNGELIKISTWLAGKNDFHTYLTPNHQVLTRTVKYNMTGGSYVTTLQWVRAGDIKLYKFSDWEGQMLCYPRVQQVEDVDVLTYDWLKIAGYYLAEGSAWKEQRCERLSLKFGSDESEHALATDAFETITRMGFKATLNYHQTGYEVSCFAKRLIEFLKQFGQGSENKHVPNRIKLLPKEKLQFLFDAYCAGDGHVCKIGHNTYHQTTTVSRQLAFDIRDIAMKIGYIASIHKPRNDRESYIHGRLIKGKEYCYVVRTRTTVPHHTVVKEDSDFVYLKPKAIEAVQYNGIVYDLEVAEDHSFTTPMFVVHNCTSKFKIQPKRHYLRQRFGEDCIFENYIGYNADEKKRVEKQKNKPQDVMYEECVYPMVDWYGMGRQAEKDFIASRGLPVPEKSGCFFCPYISKQGWKLTYFKNRDEFDEAQRIEENSGEYRKAMLPETKKSNRILLGGTTPLREIRAECERMTPEEIRALLNSGIERCKATGF